MQNPVTEGDWQRGYGGSFAWGNVAGDATIGAVTGGLSKGTGRVGRAVRAFDNVGDAAATGQSFYYVVFDPCAGSPGDYAQLASKLAGLNRSRNNVRASVSGGTPTLEPGDYVDLTTPKRRIHILDGDATGGGHRAGTGKPRKSEFPADWSDDKVIHEISDVATDPSASTQPGRRPRIIADGSRDGVDITVVLEPDGEIVTGFPTNTPRNPR